MSRRRLGRKLQSSQEQLFHWRRKPVEEVVARREGIVVPFSQNRRHDFSRDVSFLTNPCYALINPARDDDGNFIDIASGDLLVRLKYYASSDDPKGENIRDVVLMSYTHHILTVHSFEEQLNVMRVLCNLEA